MATVTKPIALDESLHTTEQTPRNLADVLAQALQMLNTTISGLNFINCVVVQTLPTTDISTTTIYLVPKNPSQTDNLYDEYINLTGTSAGWEKIGDTEIDLSNYYTKTETDTLLSAKADTSDIPTVNDGTLTIQQNGETKGTFTANQSGNSTVNIETPTTDIQTAVDEFETYNGGLLSECKVALEPIQDLHGYSEPWVGGANKNKLPLTVENLKAWNTAGTWSGNTYTYLGMDFTILTDDANNVIGIDENGATSSYPSFNIYSGTLNGSYRLCKNNARIRVYANSTQVDDWTADYSFTASGETYVIQLFTGAVTLNHQIAKPMLVLSTETDYTFTLYSNICPISGHTQVDVDVSDGQTTQEQVTVNLGGTYYSGILDIVSGVFVPKTASQNVTNVIRNHATSYYALVSGENAKANNFDTVISDKLPTASNSTAVGVFVNADGVLRINTPIEYATSADMISAYGGSIQIVYELANPTPIQLTPQQVKALVGENNLSAPLDGQEITEVKYKKMFTFDDVIAYIQSLS